MDDNECPLCLEPLDVTDQSFKPCPCGYKVCLWCYHQINEGLNGCCPACRRPYSHNAQAVDASVIKAAQEEVRTAKVKKKQDRAVAKANRPSEGHGENGYYTSHPGEKLLSQVRVLQRNLVYVTGLSLSIAKEHLLKSNQYFGSFGRILKLTVHRGKGSRDRDRDGRVTATAYVTYKHEKESNACIMAMHGRSLDDGRTFLRCQFGTTKYCSFFLKQLPCNNPNCMYLHKLARKEDCTTKDALLTGMHGPTPPSNMMPRREDGDGRRRNARRKDSASSGSVSPSQSDSDSIGPPAHDNLALRIAMSRPGPDGRNIRVASPPAPSDSSPGPSPPRSSAPPAVSAASFKPKSAANERPKPRRSEPEQGSLFSFGQAQPQSLPSSRQSRSQAVLLNGHTPTGSSQSREAKRAPPPGFASAAPRHQNSSSAPARTNGTSTVEKPGSRKGALSKPADPAHDAGTWDFEKFFAGLGKSFGSDAPATSRGTSSRFSFACGGEQRRSNDGDADLLRTLLASVDISLDLGRFTKPKSASRGQARSEYDLFGARSRGSSGHQQPRYASQQCAPARGSGRNGPAYYSGYGPPPGLSYSRESNRLDAFS